jgi:hypothetical protein
MQSRYSRLAPLSGLVFFVLLFVAFIALGGDSPDPDDPASKVLRFYSDHRGQQQAASYVLAIASVFLLWFVTELREELRQRASEPVANAVFAGGIVMCVGFLSMAASHFALADSAHKLQPAAAQALNAVDGGSWMVSYAGTLFFSAALAVAVLRLRVLPRAFGWIAAVFVVLMFTPAGWIAWLLTSVWLAAAGIVIARRRSATPSPQPA